MEARESSKTLVSSNMKLVNKLAANKNAEIETKASEIATQTAEIVRLREDSEDARAANRDLSAEVFYNKAEAEKWQAKHMGLMTAMEGKLPLEFEPEGVIKTQKATIERLQSELHEKSKAAKAAEDSLCAAKQDARVQIEQQERLHKNHEERTHQFIGHLNLYGKDRERMLGLLLNAGPNINEELIRATRDHGCNAKAIICEARSALLKAENGYEEKIHGLEEELWNQRAETQVMRTMVFEKATKLREADEKNLRLEFALEELEDLWKQERAASSQLRNQIAEMQNQFSERMTMGLEGRYALTLHEKNESLAQQEQYIQELQQHVTHLEEILAFTEHVAQRDKGWASVWKQQQKRKLRDVEKQLEELQAAKGCGDGDLTASATQPTESSIEHSSSDMQELALGSDRTGEEETSKGELSEGSGRPSDPLFREQAAKWMEVEKTMVRVTRLIRDMFVEDEKAEAATGADVTRPASQAESTTPPGSPNWEILKVDGESLEAIEEPLETDGEALEANEEALGANGEVLKANGKTFQAKRETWADWI